MALSHYSLQDLPLQRISPEEAAGWQAQLARAAALGPGARPPSPPPTTPQFSDLTTTPRPPQVGTSTRCQEIHPAWSWDQQSIYFSSNNVNTVATYGLTTPTASSAYHIYRITSDGSFISQVTGIGGFADETANDQFFPAINHAQTKLAYVHRPRVSDPFQLYILDLGTGARNQLTGVSVLNNTLNADIVSVEHPTWSPGDNLIVFAARRKSVTGDVRNLYLVDTSSGIVRQLTFGTPANGVESIDPVYHPILATHGVAFASNAAGVDGVTGDLTYVANPLRDLRRTGVANVVDHNLYLLNDQGTNPARAITQLTFGESDDREPAYQQVTVSGGGSGRFRNFLAWSSLGRTPDAGTPATNSYEIFIGNGTPESAANVPMRIITPDVTLAGAAQHQSDERYPTWSSSLPPQNPIDRIAFQSNRQNNINNLAQPLVSLTDTDLWSAEVTDITPPTLFTIDQAVPDLQPQFPGVNLSFLQGETLHIANAPLPNRGSRIGAAGDTFYFYTKVADLQAGVESVWVQIKDPDGSNTDVNGINHKLYATGSFPGVNNFTNQVYTVARMGDGDSGMGATHFMHIPYETDAQGISVTDYTYYNGNVRSDGVALSRTRLASKNPGVDDSVRWSGQSIGGDGTPNHPNNGILNTRWLQLKDDGQGADSLAGDGVFSASWLTPPDGSDFYVDLICYDNAADPLNPSLRQNWIIYDNIWGFSTAPFTSRNPILVVDDNGAGQKWPRGLKGVFRPFPTYRFGTEGELTSRSAEFWPTEVIGGAPTPIRSSFFGAIIGLPNTVSGMFDFLNGDVYRNNVRIVSYDFINWATGIRQAYRYDLWRILARGSLPDTIISDYAPTKDEQPTDITGANTRRQPVPRRAVLWSSPYTGDIFAGGGSILDQATQTLLTNYRRNSGRLVVTGGDILWAITVDGSITNQQFVQTVLGANFTGDINPNPSPLGFSFNGGPIALDVSQDPATREFVSQGSNDTNFFPDEYDLNPIGISSYFPGFNDGNGNNNGGSTVSNVQRGATAEGIPFQQQDGVTARAGWEQVIDNKMIANDDTAAGGTGSKTIFMSFNLASMGRRVHSDGDDPTMNPLQCMNYKAKLAHTMFCWMFSADLVGQVKSLAGGAPVGGAFVEAIQGGRVVGTALSRIDGTYTIRGLPVGNWGIRVTTPGFLSFFKSTGSGTHSLSQAQLDVLLTPAPPASITGTVKDQFGQPVPRAKVQAVLLASPLFTGITVYTTETVNDGTYILPNIPVGSYTLSIIQPFPTGFANPTPRFAQPVTVVPAQNTPNIDFTMDGQPGPLTVRVFQQLADGTQGPAVDGVTVTLLTSANQPIPGGYVATTGAKGVPGQVIFSATDPNADVPLNVPAGPVKVSAFLIGFQEGFASINIPQQNTVDILLVNATPQALRGIAKRKLDGVELTSADLVPAVTFSLLRKESKLPVGRTASVFAPALAAPVRHNYVFNAQQGAFIVELKNHPRWQDIQVEATIPAGLDGVAPEILLDGRDGVVTGTVHEDTNGVAGPPIAGVNVDFIPEIGAQQGQIVASALTDSTGRFTSGRALTSLRYRLQLRKFGHSSKTLTGIFVAGNTDVGDTLLVRAPRGQVFGLARRQLDGVARTNVQITFQPLAGLPSDAVSITSGPTQTGAPDGGQFNYTVGSTDIRSESLPEGTYRLTVSSDPRYQNFSGTVQVTGGQAIRFDLDLVALPGIVSGTVRERLAGGVPGLPIPGATVQVLKGGSAVATLTTDAAGRYQTNGPVAAGPATVSATAFGFFPNSVSTFVEGNVVADDILLIRMPPSRVTGTVRSSVDNTFIGDATVTLFNANGGPSNVAPVLTLPAAVPGISPVANFVLPAVPPGAYLARASKPGWTGADGRAFAERALQVNPGVNVFDLNFILVPSHIFGRGLQFISLPDDYPGVDAADLLGQLAKNLKAATWLTTPERYAIYPEDEAREFRFGKAFFVRFPATTAFATEGQAAPDAPFFLPVKAGWNSIGTVRRVRRIEWLRVKVSIPGEATPITLQEAMDRGVIQNGLFGYIDGYFRSDFLDPFAGYFMRAFRDCTLIIPVDNSVSSAPRRSQGRLVRNSVPSLRQVARELYAAGLGPDEQGRLPHRVSVQERGRAGKVPVRGSVTNSRTR
jgi:hypothetical protein